MDNIKRVRPVRFEIARSLNGTKIVYIARDHGGVVRLRSENLEDLEKMISEYRLPEPPQPAVDTEQIVNDKIDSLVEAVVSSQAEEESKKPATRPSFGGKKSSTTKTPEAAAASHQTVTREKKEFLKNELKEAIEEQKDKTEKKSFWDRLK